MQPEWPNAGGQRPGAGTLPGQVQRPDLATPSLPAVTTPIAGRPGSRPGFVGDNSGIGGGRPGGNWGRPVDIDRRPGQNQQQPDLMIGKRPVPGGNFSGQRPYPGQLPSLPQVADNRPGSGSRPGLVNRPNLNVITNNNVTNNTIINNVTNVTNVNNVTNVTNNVGNVVRPGYRPDVLPARPWRDPYDHVHQHWHHGYWNMGTVPSFWTASSSGGGSWLNVGTTSFSFQNPYYAAPVNVVAAYNYSRPIVVADSDLAVAPEITEYVARLLAAARQHFRQGEYDAALEHITEAIRQVPSDRTLHEFRALIHFARGDIRDAAAVIYSVLASGPGWDWETLSTLYPNIDLYILQVKRLTDYVAARPERADSRFLLAYHFLTMGYVDAAAEQLEIVLRLQPNDRVAAELLRALRQPQPVGSARRTSP